MATFFEASREALRAYGAKGDTKPLAPQAVSWGHALSAIAILIVAQAVILIISAGPELSAAMPALLDIGLVTLLAFAVPFIVVAGAAMLAKQPEKLPMLVMFVALSLLLIQVLSFALSYAGLRSSSALVVVTAFFVGRGVQKVLGAPISMAILAGVIAAIGTIGVSMLLLMFPVGQAIVSGA